MPNKEKKPSRESVAFAVYTTGLTLASIGFIRYLDQTATGNHQEIVPRMLMKGVALNLPIFLGLWIANTFYSDEKNSNEKKRNAHRSNSR